jgi:hypothetical protein
MEAMFSFEMIEPKYQSIWHHITEDRTIPTKESFARKESTHYLYKYSEHNTP